MDVHKAKVGYTPAQAESEFLQICKKLPRYGMHMFAVKVSIILYKLCILYWHLYYSKLGFYYYYYYFILIPILQ